jgi:hypothetical protein
LGMRLKVTKNWGHALLNFFKIKVAATKLSWTGPLIKWSSAEPGWEDGSLMLLQQDLRVFGVGNN